MKRMLDYAGRLLLALIILAAAAGAVRNAHAQNIPAVILASAARTAATVNTADQINSSWRKSHIIINVSAYVAGSYTPHVQGKDPVSGNYYDVLVGNAINATGLTVLKVGPGFGVSPNGATPDMLPQTWRVSLVGANGQSMTFSIGAFLED